jgi:2-polyprenyl-3-methyl-5-hydroxy-6-metoxy-1,4-benzoquinol methylase
MHDAFNKNRQKALDQTADVQERNRLWWESLPMTYVDWSADERTRIENNFAQVRDQYWQGNPWLEQNFDPKSLAGQRVLEIGCGAGSVATSLAVAGAKVTAIDLTEQAIKLTKMHAASMGAELEAIQMDAESMTFADQSFDFVFSWGVLHHSHDTERAFREVARVLKPGGKGLIMVYNKNSLRYYLKGLIWLLAKGKLFAGDTFETVQRHYTDGFYHRHFTPKELNDCLRRAGLTTDRLSISHMQKQMIPGIPAGVDKTLKDKSGWFLIAEITRPSQ